MANPAYAEQIRAALSYRAKVRMLDEESQRAREEGQIDEDHYASLREFYAAHRMEAEAVLAKTRNVIHKELVDWQNTLGQLHAEQGQLAAKAARGEMAPKKANARNRQLTAEIDKAGHMVSELESLVTAKEPEAVGGFIDLSLDDYRVAPPKRPIRRRVDFAKAVVLVAPFAGAVSVFAPWLHLGPQHFALTEAGPLFSRLYAPAVLSPGPASVLWISAFALPMLALAFSGVSRTRTAVVGLLATALACLVLPIMLMAFIMMTATHETATFAAILGGLGTGFYAYMAAGLAILFTAWRREAVVEENFERQRKLTLSAWASVGLSIVLTAAGVLYAQTSAGVAFRAELVDESGVVRVVVANNSNEMASVYAPWPGGAPGEQIDPRPGADVGVAVYARERDSDQWRLVSESAPAWSEVGADLRAHAGARLAPRLTRTLEFNANDLRQLGLDPEAIRLEFTDVGGDVIDTFVAELAPSEPPRRPTSRTIADQPRPVRPAPTPPARADETGAGEATEETAEELPAQPRPGQEPAQPQSTVRLVGRFEDDQGISALLEVYDPVEGNERISVRPGETAFGPWVVVDVNERPFEVTLQNTLTGESVDVPSRQTVSIPTPR